MTIDFTVERPLFLHSIENPQAQDVTCNITLNLQNPTGLVELIKIGGGSHTEYNMRLDRPLQVGFTDSGQTALDRGLSNFVLALNLSLSKTCAMLSIEQFFNNNVQIKRNPPDPGTVTNDGQGHITVSLQETLVMRDHVSIEMGMKEDIDEPTVLAIFKRLQNSRSVAVTSTSPFTESNLGKALESYEHAMKAADRLAIFKHLYSAIELAANYDGSKDHDIDLDNKISAITAVSTIDAAAWRNLNNRAKHADQKVKHIQDYLNAVNKLPTENHKVRDCARALILARLP